MSGRPADAAEIIDREILLTRAMSRPTLTARAWVVALLVVTAGFAGMSMTLRGRPGMGEFTWRHALVFGEKANPLIADGQVWRLASSVWLHADPLHLAINAWALWLLGVLVERLYGRRRFVALVGFGGIGGAALSYATTAAPSVGASGAAFALVGALGVFAVRWRAHLPRRFARVLAAQVALYVIAGVAVAIVSDRIDHAAHLGGLVTGVVVAAWLGAPSVDLRQHERAPRARLAAIVAGGLLVFGLVLGAREVSRCGGSASDYNACYGAVAVTTASPTRLESGEALD